MSNSAAATSILSINRAESRDQGEYVCEASDSNVTVITSETVQIPGTHSCSELL